MKNNDIRAMSTHELWNLHGEVATILGHKIAAEKAMLLERLRRIELAAKFVQVQSRTLLVSAGPPPVSESKNLPRR